jgi:hypothetical protein
MKYFLDTEFIESGPKSPIQLISIGIISEDNRELYLQNADFYELNANDWVKENVIAHLECLSNWRQFRAFNTEESLIGTSWRRFSKIAKEIIEFITNDTKPEFWGYYADYDWVVFCQIFGTMMDLPTSFPMYCNDLKQLCNMLGNPQLPQLEQIYYCLGCRRMDHTLRGHICLNVDKEGKQPKSMYLKEHHALNDARWNKYIYNFIQNSLPDIFINTLSKG